jgi:subtilisin family serine protease
MKTLRPFRAKNLLRPVLALTIVLGAANADAQLRLPSINLPLPTVGLPSAGSLLGDTGERLGRLRELPDLREFRLGQVKNLLRKHRDVLEADPRGEPVVRREILAWSPSPAGLAAAQAAGLTLLREQRLGGLDEVMLVLHVPQQADTARLLEQLRARDPQGTYDFNHIYTGSGAAAGATAARPGAAEPASRDKDASVSVGLVDSGVDLRHDVFRDARIERWGCADLAHPDPHGTAVAALMVGQSRNFRGVAPQAKLFAADIYCDSASGGSADRIAGALAWLSKENVAVINMSIVGPANATLERVVAAMVRRGHLLVAAVGNDGPAAAPLYPASYPGVVGVSAVDRRGRVLPEAGRGPQVMFAAPGNNMVSAAPGEPPFRQVRGTSFAAPIVAAMLAATLPRPDRQLASGALAALARQAERAERDEAGYGVVGQAFRIDPSALR